MNLSFPPSLCSLMIILLSFELVFSSETNDRRPYIVHMDVSAMPAPFATHESWYLSMLSSLPTPSGGRAPTHLYTYTHVMHGFSAVLTPAQLRRLERMEGHLATYPESYARLHTTDSPQFLGLNPSMGIWPASNYGADVIVGIIDTGIWPESKSFRDEGMPPVPARWKGKCETGDAFNASLCNRKLVGARSFSKGLKHSGISISSDDDYDSPRDFYGHGSHTSSTAAGSRVPGASYFGYAPGTATGIAPLARVAMYKAIFADDDLNSAATDVLAAMEQAIVDGVDVMSLSLGFPESAYYLDVMAIGAFAAMEKGVFVVCSAGNSGPQAYSIFNGAPWITTVGAGTIDRDYYANITLGSGVKSLRGRSIYPKSTPLSNLAIYYGRSSKQRKCNSDSLDKKSVAGKIVFCSAGVDGARAQLSEVQSSGALGAVITTDEGEQLDTSDFYMPFATVGLSDGEVIRKFIAGTKAPRMSVRFGATQLGPTIPAPQVAYFSSRGPSPASSSILKPDILAPGVDILAAWVPNRPFVEVGDDNLYTDYALASGTSMSSPHIAGVAAMLRSIHKDWSPAAIRSAMMTTADLVDNTGRPITDMVGGSAASPLDFGAGHLNPNRAMDPGLVYDSGSEDYIEFLCGLGYTNQQIKVITKRRDFACSKANLDLNYPSFMVILNKTTNSATRTFKRVLTSVGGSSPSRYKAVVNAPTGMKVAVAPAVLVFGNNGSKQQFALTVQINLEYKANENHLGNYGFLSWNEDGGNHVVTSPIVSAYASD
ncbi:Subtilisin-like protease SBT1.7 [Ananas comosus]|uniref:Subtilisin-like protease SBT1.7 n=1 Tax=Ananas comosus TaxID=4615 RepID=A0A199UJ10_ANACO|nr:Subtilisin-like protease SBT1.7 [Ananas comosus]